MLGKNSGNVNRIPKAIAGCCPAVAHRPDKPAANSYRMLTCGCTCMKRALAVVAFEDNCTLWDGNIRKRLELQLMLRLQKSNIDGKRMPTLDSHDECRIGSSRTVAPCKSLRSHGQVHQEARCQIHAGTQSGSQQRPSKQLTRMEDISVNDETMRLTTRSSAHQLRAHDLRLLSGTAWVTRV